jgi:hypothetical protein
MRAGVEWRWGWEWEWEWVWICFKEVLNASTFKKNHFLPWEHGVAVFINLGPY